MLKEVSVILQILGEVFEITPNKKDFHLLKYYLNCSDPLSALTLSKKYCNKKNKKKNTI